MSTYGQIGSFVLKDSISSIDFSSTGDYFSVGGLEETLYIWNAVFQPIDKNVIMRKEGHCLGIVDVKFNNKGSNIAVSSLDSMIKNWDIDTNSFIEIECDPMSNWRIAFHDRTIYTAGNLGRICLYDSVSGQKTQQHKTQDVFINSISLNPTAETIAVGNTVGAVFLVNSNTGAVTKYQIHQKAIRGINFSDDSSKVITVSDDCTIRIFDINSESAIGQLSGHKNAITGLHTSLVDKTIVTCSLDKMVKIWDIRTKNAVGTISYHSSPVWAVKFSNDGKVVASGGESGIVAIHSLR